MAPWWGSDDAYSISEFLLRRHREKGRKKERGCYCSLQGGECPSKTQFLEYYSIITRPPRSLGKWGRNGMKMLWAGIGPSPSLLGLPPGSSWWSSKTLILMTWRILASWGYSRSLGLKSILQLFLWRWRFKRGHVSRCPENRNRTRYVKSPLHMGLSQMPSHSIRIKTQYRKYWEIQKMCPL